MVTFNNNFCKPLHSQLITHTHTTLGIRATDQTVNLGPVPHPVCCPEVTNSLITYSFQCDSLWINVFHRAVTQRESNGLIRFVG
jgi:hypothetical protein